MMEFDIIQPTPRFVEALACELRPGDRAEIATVGMTSLHALELSVNLSYYSRGAVLDGRPAAAWGVAGDIISEIGFVWLLTGRAVESNRFDFVRKARAEVSKMHSFYPRLVGSVGCDYPQAHRLLRLLGFSIGPDWQFSMGSE